MLQYKISIFYYNQVLFTSQHSIAVTNTDDPCRVTHQITNHDAQLNFIGKSVWVQGTHVGSSIQ